MVSDLPADILLLICEELGNRQDFGTLFNCALSSKVLVDPALSWLYRVHNQSRLISTDSNDTELSKTSYVTFQARVAQQIKTISKWALLWKSIIRSSLRNTAYPYARYIRSLDLRNLAELLDDTLFREHALDTFFADDMARFLQAQEFLAKKRTRRGKAIGMRLNIPDVLNLVGESITRFVSEAATTNGATVALEDISGNISAVALPRWIGRLSRLKSMTLWDCAPLNEDVANTINYHCPNFDDLTFYLSSRDDMDHDFGSFLGALRPNSLGSFTALGALCIGAKTLHGLNNHANSLKTLKLNGLKSGGIKMLSLLRGCVALECLQLEDADGLIDLEATENDVFLKVVDWLGRCERLRELFFKKLVNAPAILTHVFLRNSIRLQELNVTYYPLNNNQDFHKALSHQSSLKSLILTADPEGAYRDDIDTLVSSVCQLTKLTQLDLVGTADYFRTPEIQRIASSLGRLDTFSFTGYDVTDEALRAMSNLHNLRYLNVHAVTAFSFDGILNYISTLQPTNQGIVLSVLSQSGDHDLSDKNKSIIQQSIAEKVDGRFEFQLFREAESDIESDSD